MEHRHVLRGRHHDRRRRFSSDGAWGRDRSDGLVDRGEHELGRELGLSDINSKSNPSDLMAATLAPGVRRQPTTQEFDALFASLGGPPS
jgi:hypothetical protein